jgi:hypothetical protein
MKHVSLYRKSDGYITHQLSANDERDIPKNAALLSETHGSIEGHPDPTCHRVDPDTGTLHKHVWPGRVDPLQNQAAQRTIYSMEVNLQPRVQRELLLAIAKKLGLETEASRLKDIDDEIADLRKQLDKGEG